MTRRILVVLGLWLLLIGVGAWTFAPREAYRSPMTAIVPPPIHVEWEQFEVGGYVLVNPRDTTFIVIPEGALLQTPHLVEGPGPDDL